MKHYAMVMLGVLALLASACQKPDIHSAQALQDALAKYMKAINKGDGEAFYDIHSAQQRQGISAEQRKQGFPSRKNLEFKFEGVVLRNQSAGVFGRFAEDGKSQEDEQALFFVLENGQWKLDRQLGSNSPIHRPAFVPPESGRFIVAGMPWKDVPLRDMSEVATGGLGYELQGACDESFLYLRLVFKNALPKPDSPLTDPGKGLPEISPRTLRVAATGAKGNFEVVFDTTTVTHFRNGVNTFALGYNVALQDKEAKPIFYTNASSEEKLLQVGERDIIARIPLESLAAGSANATNGFTLSVVHLDKTVDYQAKKF